MNKSQLIEELSKRVGNDKEEIRYILEELNNIILEKTRAVVICFHFSNFEPLETAHCTC